MSPTLAGLAAMSDGSLVSDFHPSTRVVVSAKAQCRNGASRRDDPMVTRRRRWASSWKGWWPRAVAGRARSDQAVTGDQRPKSERVAVQTARPTCVRRVEQSASSSSAAASAIRRDDVEHLIMTGGLSICHRGGLSTADICRPRAPPSRRRLRCSRGRHAVLAKPLNEWGSHDIFATPLPVSSAAPARDSIARPAVAQAPQPAPAQPQHRSHHLRLRRTTPAQAALPADVPMALPGSRVPSRPPRRPYNI